MRYRTSLFLLLTGTAFLFSLAGCGKQKYRLNLDGYGLRSEKKAYAAGEEVRITYDLVASDTNYRFYIDGDEKMNVGFDGRHGYLLTFLMPARDVTVRVEWENSMEHLPVSAPEIPSGRPDGEDIPEGSWRCPDCGSVNTTAFCPECGVKRPVSPAETPSS